MYSVVVFGSASVVVIVLVELDNVELILDGVWLWLDKVEFRLVDVELLLDDIVLDDIVLDDIGPDDAELLLDDVGLMLDDAELVAAEY